jgi:hypothetical protein
MKISGVTIVRNAIRYGYPAVEAIKAVLPICDEFIVNVGDSSDGTLELIKSIKDPKIKIVERVWDMSIGQDVLSLETDYAISQCQGDWVIYAQTDELIHEEDLWQAKKYMQRYLNILDVDGFHFKWLHFYGSFYRYRIDAGWFQKQIRIIRNDGLCESHDGAWGFRRKDKKPMRTVKTPFFIYHYGWVNDPQMMAVRRKNAYEVGMAGPMEFQVSEFEKSLDKIKPLLTKLGQSSDRFENIDTAVDWLNKCIEPFQIYADYIKSNKVDKNVQDFLPINFETMTEAHLKNLAFSANGRGFKRAILNYLYPHETPKMYFSQLTEKEKKPEYDYGDLNRFPVYFGTHPAVMRHLIEQHVVSQQDWQKIVSRYWWNPLLWFRVRYKTGRRVKERIT